MKVSTASSVLVNYLLEDAVKQVISAGFDGIDVWCGRPHLFRQDYPRDCIRDLGDSIRANGLRVVSVMPAFFRYPFSLSSPLESICNDSVLYMMDCVDNAELIGAEAVLVVPSNNLFGQTPSEARKIFIRNLAKLCEYADLKGIRLSIEVLNPKLSSFVYEAKQSVEIIREIGADNLGVTLDTGHLNLSGEDAESALDNVGELLWHVHINDNDAKEQQNAVPGDGNFDFARFKHLLNKHGYTGFLSLELGWHYSFNPDPVLNRAISVTKEFMV